MPYKIQLRRGTAAQWIAANPILADGEMGIESDTRKVKVGDGTTAWNSLGYNLLGDVADDAVTTAKILNNAVTEPKIANNAVTQSKLASTLSGITVCTSTTRPASPFEGQSIYETDTDVVKSYNGASWATIGPTVVPAVSTVFGNVLQTVMYKVPWTTASTTSTSYVQNTNFDVRITTTATNSFFIIYGWLNLSTVYNYGLHKLTATPVSGSLTTVLECPAAYDRGPFAGTPGGEMHYWAPNYASGTVIDFDWYYRAGYGGAADATGVASSIGLSVNDTRSNKWSQNVIVFHEVAASGAVTFKP